MFLLPSLVFSTPGLSSAELAARQANIAIAIQQSSDVLQARGLIAPDSGIQLVPKSELKYSKEERKKFAFASAQQKNIGYYKSFSSRAKELINIDETVAEIKKHEGNGYKPYQTYLRKSKDEMQMAYTYVGVPESEIAEYIGIAPAYTYVEDPIKGWSGAIELFKTKFANCAYSENNLRISHGAARVSQEDATHEVNGKITLIIIEGTRESGYLYKIKWFSSDFIRELECAKDSYSDAVKKSVIALASAIDKA